MVVRKEIQGKVVEALPQYRGGCEPAYWIATVNSKILNKTFQSPRELFRFIEVELHVSQ